MTELRETLPRSGYVNEASSTDQFNDILSARDGAIHRQSVCKEWLVREDGALAYQLQNEEISEFYNGNRVRNAVVRQDFPTALHEQIREKEDAVKEAERRHRQLWEQERADAEIAKQIADKLERDRERERLKECNEGETVAKLLQRAYIEKSQVNDNADYLVPLPPNILHRNPMHLQQHGDVANICSTRDVDLHEIKVQQAQQLHSRSPLNNPSLSPAYEIVNSAQKPLPPLPLPARNVLPPKRNPSNPQIRETSPQSSNFPSIERQTSANGSSSLHCDNVVESIRHYNLNDSMLIEQRSSSSSLRSNDHLKSHQLQLSPQKYDYIMQNLHLDSLDEVIFPENCKPIDDTRQNASANGIRSNKPALANIKNVAALKVLGISSDEALELDRKLEQEKRDEELAVRLQKEEARESLTQEERDRLLAIEAQDKELAKMLQERERAKARRAKEKARLKKMQGRPQSDFEGHSFQRSPGQPQSPRPAVDMLADGDSYSNPIDLISSGHSSLDSSYRHERMSSSISADHTSLNLKDDEIYTLPVEDEINVVTRPTTLAVSDENQKAQTRGNQSPESFGNIATVIDPTYTSPGGSQQNQTLSSSLGYNTNNAPPYMPIQGTRRSASLDAKKKKTKDKCTHQ